MNDFWIFLTSVSIWGIAKLLVFIALAIYLVFAVVTIRQVYAMVKVVSSELDFAIKIVAWIHLVLTLLVIFLAAVVL